MSKKSRFMCSSIISVSVSFCNILSVILRGFLHALMTKRMKGGALLVLQRKNITHETNK